MTTKVSSYIAVSILDHSHSSGHIFDITLRNRLDMIAAKESERMFRYDTPQHAHS